MPQPDGPSTDSNSPFFSVKLTSFSACTVPPLGMVKIMFRFSATRSLMVYSLIPVIRFPVSPRRGRPGLTRSRHRAASACPARVYFRNDVSMTTL